jgi:hypothetical protein
LTKFVDLEVSFQKREDGKYNVDLRLGQPDSEADTRPGSGAPIAVEFDFSSLQVMITDPKEYGLMLAESLFVPEMVTAFAEARAVAQSGQFPLRVRLLAGPGAPEINTIYWEALRDPKDKSPLFTGENLFLSRYLASSDLRPVKLRPQGALKALTAASNPSDLANSKLAPVDVAGELGRAKEALGAIPVTELGSAEPCTLNALVAKLRGGYDILYLAAHGTMAESGPRVWLQKEDGSAAVTSAEEIVTRIRELQNPPRLVVLASCQSAGDGKPNKDAGRVLQAFGPGLAQAGIPAVIAMQGNISMDSVKKFLPVFFSELQKDGQIDRALGVARGTIREAHDFWMPVLFMRLRSGKIWYVPGVGEEGDEFDKWPALLNAIRNNASCTPIVGPGLYEPLIGSWQEMAEALAEEFHFPLASFLRQSIPQVTQYVSTHYDVNTLFTSFDTMMRKALQTRFAEHLPDPLKKPNASIAELFRQGGHKAREADEAEAHHVLASLPLRIYITTNYDDMLADALRETEIETESGEKGKKRPEVVICPWSERFYAPSIYDDEPGYTPSIERPLVYHLFGHLSIPDSMVLTEDDYFEFLMGFTANKKRTPPVIPPAVLRALTDTALLILGFSLDDWSFRALFRTVMVQPGSARRGRYSHVGIQLEPDDARNMNPKRAHAYLQKYFGDAQINLYWGKSEDFLRELAQRWKAA